MVLDGFLASEGLSYEDVQQVPVSGLSPMWDLFMQGKTLTAIVTLGSAAAKQMEAALGGVRYLSFDNSPQAVAALNRHVPRAHFELIQPGPQSTGLLEPSKLLYYGLHSFRWERRPPGPGLSGDEGDV